MRKVSHYISHLPMESATVTAMRKALDESGVELESNGEPGGGPWSMVEMLLATVVDELRSLRYTTVQVNSDKPVGSAPEPIPRPGTVKKRRKLTRERAAVLDPRLREGGDDG